MRKYNWWLLILVLPMLVLAGCGNRRGHRMYQDSEVTTDTPAEDEENQETDVTEDTIGDEDNNDDEEIDEEYEDEWIGMGTYHEQIDSHRIEVEMDEEVETYQLTNWAQEDLKNHHTGENISFYYYEDNDELIIDEIHDSDFDWEEEYGFDTRYNHHHRNNRNHHKNHHRNNKHHPRNRRHHRRQSD